MYLLLPISLLLVAVVIAVLVWAANSGQFDDLEGPAERLLMDDDDVPDSTRQSAQRASKDDE